MTFALRAPFKVLLVATVVIGVILALATVGTFVSTWGGVRIHPTSIHFDASEGVPRALMSVDASVEGLDRSVHGIAVRGGSCELFAGRGGTQRILVARALNVEHQGSAARMVAELEHGSVNQAMQIMADGPAKDLLCNFDVEVDLFKTGFKLSRTFRAPDFLKEKEDFGFRFKVVRDPMKWQYPQSREDMHVKAHARHWVEMNVFTHSPEKLADFLKGTAVHVKAGVTYADEEHGAVQLNGHVDSPLHYKIEGAGKQTKVALAIPVDFHGTTHIKQLAHAAKAAAFGGRSVMKVEKNGAVSYSTTFRAQRPTSPLAVALGDAHVLKMRTDGPVDVKHMVNVLKNVKVNLLSTLKSMHPAADKRRLASAYEPKIDAIQQKTTDDVAFKIKVIVSINEDQKQAIIAEVREGKITNMKVTFMTRSYGNEDEKHYHMSSLLETRKFDMTYVNVTAGVDIDSAKSSVTAYVHQKMDSASQETKKQSSKEGKTQSSSYEWSRNTDSAHASLMYDDSASELKANFELNLKELFAEFHASESYDVTACTWFTTNKVQAIADPAGGLRRLSSTGCAQQTPPPTSDSPTSVRMTAAVDFNGDGSATSHATADLSLAIGNSYPIKLDAKYHLKEPKKDELLHDFHVSAQMPVKKIIMDLMTDGKETGNKEYWVVSSMSMTGSITTDISGKNMKVTGPLKAEKLKCNALLTDTRGSGSSSYYTKLTDTNKAVCPILTKNMMPPYDIKMSGEASCCSDYKSSNEEVDAFMDTLKEMPMTMDKEWSDTINAEMSNPFKENSNFDVGNMKMDGSSAGSDWMPKVETKVVNGVNHMSITFLDGAKEQLSIQATSKDNDKNGQTLAAEMSAEGKKQAKVSGYYGDKSDVWSAGFLLETYDGDAKMYKHAVSFDGVLDQNKNSVGKHGSKYTHTVFAEHPKKQQQKLLAEFLDKGTSSTDLFNYQVMWQNGDEQEQGMQGMIQRNTVKADEDYTMKLMPANLEDFPYFQATGSKTLAGKKYEAIFKATEKSLTGKQMFQWHGKAEKTISGADKTYSVMWNVKADDPSKALVSHTASFANKATQGILTTTITVDGKDMLKADSTMTKKNSRFEGDIIVTSLNKEDIEIPSDLAISAKASEGFLPIASKPDFTMFDVAVTVKIENIAATSSFYCEQPPDKLPNAMPWSGLGMAVQAKEENRKIADVNWDVDLPINKDMTIHHDHDKHDDHSGHDHGPTTTEPGPTTTTTKFLPVTSFTSVVNVNKATDFVAAKFQESMTKLAGSGKATVAKVKFHVKVAYQIKSNKAVDKDKIQEVIASTHGVAKENVEVVVTTGRRLRQLEAIERMLSGVTQNVAATIKTTDPKKADTVKETASSLSALTNAMKTKFNIVATTLLTSKPAMEAHVESTIKSTTGEAVKAPPTAVMNNVARDAGGTGGKVVASTVSVSTSGGRQESKASSALGLGLSSFNVLPILAAVAGVLV